MSLLPSYRVVAFALVLALSPPADAKQGQWIVSASPITEIGAGEEFTRIGSVFRQNDGTVVVPNLATNQVRLFRADGTRIRSVGRTGQGPGEYQAMGAIMRGPADTMFVWDWPLQRITVLAPSGTLVRTIAWSGSGNAAGRGVPLAMLNDGSFIVERVKGIGFPFPGAEGEVRTVSTAFARIAADGRELWTLPPVPQREVVGVPFANGRSARVVLAPYDRPFGPRLAWAMAGDTLLYATGSSTEWFAVTPAGDVRRRTGGIAARVPFATAHRDAFVSALMAAGARDSTNPASRTAAPLLAALNKGRLPFPAELPAHGRLITDGLGYLWIQDPDRAALREIDGGLHPGSPTWSVVDHTGRVRRVDMPARFRVDEIGKDYVLGVWRDEDDVEHVRMYALRRGV